MQTVKKFRKWQPIRKEYFRVFFFKVRTPRVLHFKILVTTLVTTMVTSLVTVLVTEMLVPRCRLQWWQFWCAMVTKIFSLATAAPAFFVGTTNFGDWDGSGDRNGDRRFFCHDKLHTLFISRWKSNLWRHLCRTQCLQRLHQSVPRHRRNRRHHLPSWQNCTNWTSFQKQPCDKWFFPSAPWMMQLMQLPFRVHLPFLMWFPLPKKMSLKIPIMVMFMLTMRGLQSNANWLKRQVWARHQKIKKAKRVGKVVRARRRPSSEYLSKTQRAGGFSNNAWNWTVFCGRRNVLAKKRNKWNICCSREQYWTLCASSTALTRAHCIRYRATNWKRSSGGRCVSFVFARLIYKLFFCFCTANLLTNL